MIEVRVRTEVFSPELSRLILNVAEHYHLGIITPRVDSTMKPEASFVRTVTGKPDQKAFHRVVSDLAMNQGIGGHYIEAIEVASADEPTE